jgi:hypothetical protein
MAYYNTGNSPPSKQDCIQQVLVGHARPQAVPACVLLIPVSSPVAPLGPYPRSASTLLRCPALIEAGASAGGDALVGILVLELSIIILTKSRCSSDTSFL